MAKKPTLHPYSDQQAFDRLLLLIATLLQYPGIGCTNKNDRSSTSDRSHHNALETVRIKLREFAAKTGYEFPENYPSVSTIRKDLELLRRYGILSDRIYRWGYYLGTGVLNQEELSIALNALASQAKYQEQNIKSKISRKSDRPANLRTSQSTSSGFRFNIRWEIFISRASTVKSQHCFHRPGRNARTWG